MHLQGWENVCAELTTSLAPQQQIHSKLKAHWAFHSNLITSLVTPLEELGGWGASCKGQVPNESAAPQVLLKKLGKGIFFFCADVQHIQEKAMWKDVLQPSQMIQSHYSLSPLWGYPAGHPHYSELGKQHESQSSMVGNQKACKENIVYFKKLSIFSLWKVLHTPPHSIRYPTPALEQLWRGTLPLMASSHHPTSGGSVLVLFPFSFHCLQGTTVI